MLDTPTLQCNRVSFCRSAVVQNRQQIFKFASIGHGTPPVSTKPREELRRPALLDHDYDLPSEDRIVHLHVWPTCLPSSTRTLRSRHHPRTRPRRHLRSIGARGWRSESDTERFASELVGRFQNSNHMRTLKTAAFIGE